MMSRGGGDASARATNILEERNFTKTLIDEAGIGHKEAAEMANEIFDTEASDEEEDSDGNPVNPNDSEINDLL